MNRRRIPGERSPLSATCEELELLAALRPYVRQASDAIRQPWHIGERKLLDYLVVGIGSGAGVFTVGEETFPVGKWDVVWIPPNTVHEMRGTEPMRCAYLHFDLLHNAVPGRWDACIPPGTLDLSEFNSLIQPKTGTVADSWRGKLELANAPEALGLIRRIAAERWRQAPGYNISLAGMLLELVSLIMRGTARSGGTDARTAQGRVRRVASTLAERGGSLSVDRMAKDSSVSLTHFRRLFKKAYGRCPREMALEERMRQACELLVYSSLNISEVADRLGYANVHNFSRAFAKEFGVAPGAYRDGL